jgi:putative flippase GtrA
MNHSYRIPRFAAIGILNTATDASLYVGFRTIGFNFVIANMISTSIGLILSLTLNSKFTFKESITKQIIIKFLLVTIVGLWILQPIILISANTLGL